MNEKYLKVVRLPDMERGAERIEPSVDRLMFAVVQAQDVRKASRALNAAGLLVAQLTSTGGFLGRRNVTLLIGMRENQ